MEVPLVVKLDIIAESPLIDANEHVRRIAGSAARLIETQDKELRKLRYERSLTWNTHHLSTPPRQRTTNDDA